MRWWWGPLCTRPLKQQSTDTHVAPLGTLYWFWVNQSLILLLSGEPTNINFIVFGLKQSGLHPMIYHTGGEHNLLNSFFFLSKIHEHVIIFSQLIWCKSNCLKTLVYTEWPMITWEILIYLLRCLPFKKSCSSSYPYNILWKQSKPNFIEINFFLYTIVLLRVWFRQILPYIHVQTFWLQISSGFSVTSISESVLINESPPPDLIYNRCFKYKQVF